MMNAHARWSILAVPVLAVLSCSDPVPLPAQGAISVSVQKPSGGANCPETGFTYNVGAPNPPSISDPGNSVIDGESGAQISCSVHKTSAGYTFSGSMHGTTNKDPRFPVTVTFNGGLVSADQTSGTATVTVFTPNLAGTFTSASGGCALKIVNKQIKNGSIWATFSCNVSAPPMQACALGSDSTIVFENCDGS